MNEEQCVAVMATIIYACKRVDQKPDVSYPMDRQHYVAKSVEEAWALWRGVQAEVARQRHA